MQQPNKATAEVLFEGRKHYVIPAYQRPYVWNEEDQWSPLWEDVIRMAEGHVRGDERAAESHFLGAVVFELLQAGSSGMTELEVIDGQQRLTTMQLLLNAAQAELHVQGHEEASERLEELILNRQSLYARTPRRFKLWPSQTNQVEFAHAMDPAEPGSTEPDQIQRAHDYFREEARRWLLGLPEGDGEAEAAAGSPEERAQQLAETLASRLVVVAIDLTGDDDAQLIFETLNDRGTPLLKADLIKNWVFRHGRELGADVDMWSRTIWDDFDSEWWRAEIAQGRLVRSRVDIFLHYWLTMRLREEVKADQVFRSFRDYAELNMSTPDDADQFLKELRADADTYRGLGDLDDRDAIGQYRSRVIETMELAATTPIFLWVISSNHQLPRAQVEIALSALESWVIRRTLLGLTSKDVNKLVVALLKTLDIEHALEAGLHVRAFLSQQTANARVWPSNERFLEEVVSRRMYGFIKGGRIVAVLKAIEEAKRKADSRYGELPLPTNLTLEHVMPQNWRQHWAPTTPFTPEQESARERAIQSLGNLTLIPQALNSSLSNRPWTDEAARGMTQGGQNGKGKWSILNQFNLQVLNKEILENRDQWSEAEIDRRSVDLAKSIIEVWPGPDALPQGATHG